MPTRLCVDPPSCLPARRLKAGCCSPLTTQHCLQDLILLSGGLCSSHYVQRQLRAAYSDQLWGGIANVPSIRISTDPTMCVAKGLVIDTVQRLERSSPAVVSITSRLGYGVLLGKKLSKVGATGASKEQQDHDEDEGRKRSRRHIRWLVKPVSIPFLISLQFVVSVRPDSSASPSNRPSNRAWFIRDES